jgi:hypothetical protein
MSNFLLQSLFIKCLMKWLKREERMDFRQCRAVHPSSKE